MICLACRIEIFYVEHKTKGTIEERENEKKSIERGTILFSHYLILFCFFFVMIRLLFEAVPFEIHLLIFLFWNWFVNSSSKSVCCHLIFLLRYLFIFSRIWNNVANVWFWIVHRICIGIVIRLLLSTTLTIRRLTDWSKFDELHIHKRPDIDRIYKHFLPIVSRFIFFPGFVLILL